MIFVKLSFFCIIIFLRFFTAMLNPVENSARWRRSFMGPVKHGFEVIWENTVFSLFMVQIG